MPDFLQEKHKAGISVVCMPTSQMGELSQGLREKHLTVTQLQNRLHTFGRLLSK